MGEEEERRKKAIGIFNIVKFDNDVCQSNNMNMNGTCYTAEECSDRNGGASGTCAEGYGVCCIITLSCGSTTTIPAVGQCNSDVFSVTGAPVICGTNNGQHVIVDTDGTQCVNAVFGFAGAGNMVRYTIHVLQFASSNEMGGPPGCLQFFTGATGTVSSFNWAGAATTTTSVHLANQNYDVCVRPLATACVLCWAVPTTASFGVSVSPTPTAGASGTGAACTSDSITIPFGFATAAAAMGVFTAPLPALPASTFCGRFLNSASAATANGPVCSPFFSLGVNFDGAEAGVGAAIGTANTNEVAIGVAGNTGAFGTSGFSLMFTQTSVGCP